MGLLVTCRQDLGLETGPGCGSHGKGERAALVSRGSGRTPGSQLGSGSAPLPAGAPGKGQEQHLPRKTRAKGAPRRGWGCPAALSPTPVCGRRLGLGSERSAAAAGASSRPLAASPGILHPHPPLLPASAVEAAPRRGPGMPSPPLPPSSRNGGGGL